MAKAVDDPELVAMCGLYCGACRSHLSGRCPGCARNESATWCGIRRCVQSHGWKSCADCTLHEDLHDCPDFHNAISRVIGYCLGSDRFACCARIHEIGREAFAHEMAAKNAQTIPKKSWNPLDCAAALDSWLRSRPDRCALVSSLVFALSGGAHSLASLRPRDRLRALSLLRSHHDCADPAALAALLAPYAPAGEHERALVAETLHLADPSRFDAPVADPEPGVLRSAWLVGPPSGSPPPSPDRRESTAASRKRPLPGPESPPVDDGDGDDDEAPAQQPRPPQPPARPPEVDLSAAPADIARGLASLPRPPQPPARPPEVDLSAAPADIARGLASLVPPLLAESAAALGAAAADDLLVSRVCAEFAALGPSAASCEALAASVLLPRARALDAAPSRAAVSAAAALLEAFPSAACGALAVPLVAGPGFGAPQADLLARALGETSGQHVVAEVLKTLLQSVDPATQAPECTAALVEAISRIIQALDCQAAERHAFLGPLVSYLHQAAASQSSSVKFVSLLLSVYTRFEPRLDDQARSLLQAAAKANTTFLKSSVLAKIKATSADS
eukprot:m51a1_g14733 hypothetical protein (563) ;mRNA; r:234482-236480